MSRFNKFTIIIVILLLIVSNAMAAENKKGSANKQVAEKAKPQTTNNDYDNMLAMLMASGAKTYWSLVFEHSHKDYPPKSNYEVGIQLLQADMNKKENKQLSPYVDTLHELLSSLDTFGKDKVYFLVNKDDIPFRIITYNGKKTIVIYKLGISTVYNVVKLTAKERASKVIASNIIPALKIFDRNLNKSDFNYYKIFLTYGSKDFRIDEDQDNLKPETIAMIIDKSACSKFLENQLTDQELIDKSVILLSDRDAGSDFSRIKVNLQ